MRKTSVSIILMALSVQACSPFMEADRPNPVRLSQFPIGESRMDVLSKIGGPLSTTQDSGNSCDIYKLYTTGPSKGGKTAIAAGEAVADVFTLGLAEVIFTPTEIATKNEEHVTVFCYSPDDKLVSVTQADTATGTEPK
jgi:hypothetical protein